MNLEECYAQLHGDYAEAKSRLMNDKLVEKFVLKFLDDPTMSKLLESVAANSRKDAFEAVHTLKGVAGNLAFTDLRQVASALTEQLRPLSEDADPMLVEDVRRSYQLVVDTIREYKGL